MRDKERGRMREIDRLRGTEEGQESGREYKTDKEEEALIASHHTASQGMAWHCASETSPVYGVRCEL
jgi:hypothetical protein